MQEHTRKFKIAQQQLNTKLLHQIDSLHVRRDKRRVPPLSSWHGPQAALKVLLPQR